MPVCTAHAIGAAAGTHGRWGALLLAASPCSSVEINTVPGAAPLPPAAQAWLWQQQHTARYVLSGHAAR